MHDTPDIDLDTGEAEKPEVISLDNLTTGGDVVDKMKGEYTAGKKSSRWPLTVFNSLLDTAGIKNSQIIFKNNTEQIVTRRSFLKELMKQLTQRFVYMRGTIPVLSSSIKRNIHKISETNPDNQQTT
ncbi:hypothetical protein L798_12169 [Zootermopsis nevadensis]|uniref:PiggyBac transposable element-derived protein domain-containing protein n=1 Tax=Zootermopsis nevadensis TaxID=136037 RepID=A0A067RS35_ZOONE|nr:hypothetical protein L798_12169 [Zootermopsis nevadensis]